MSPELPPNIKLGQLRRTVGLLPSDEWRGLDESEREALDALRLHICLRGRQPNTQPSRGRIAFS